MAARVSSAPTQLRSSDHIKCEEVSLEVYRLCVMCTRVVLTGMQGIFRLHHSTTYVDAAYCYQPSSVVCLSVCHTSEPCKNSGTNRDAVWVEDLGGPREPSIRWGPDPRMAMDNFEGKGCPIVNYRDTLGYLCKNG